MSARGEFARRMARKYLRQYRVTAPPVPVEYILVMESVAVETLDYPDDTAGESWREEGVAHIAVNRRLPRGRLRFTLAHEFGHLALHHHERRFTDPSLAAPRLRDLEDAAWNPAEPIEVEANQFATELLMPAVLFRKDWEKNSHPGWLASRYEVSMEAVRWRIVGLAG